MIDSYVNVLKESLEQKNKILQQIIMWNKKQYDILKEDDLSLEAFDETVENKGTLIEELQRLDRGFELVYDKVSKELQDNREQFKIQIKEMQVLISQITEKSMTVKAEELRNKQLVEQSFASAKQKLKQGKVSTKVAANYYQNMNKTNYIDPQFMDSKK